MKEPSEPLLDMEDIFFLTHGSHQDGWNAALDAVREILPEIELQLFDVPTGTLRIDKLKAKLKELTK